jgi:hypothetical protein
MMVVDQARPERGQRQANEKEKVRRIANVYDPHTVPEADSERDAELGQDSDQVLDQIGEGPPRLGTGPVSVDPDAGDCLAPTRMLSRGRADDMNLVSGTDKREGLLPDPAIERNGKVLDEDQDM